MHNSTGERSASFSTDGIVQLSTTNSTFVQCRSKHLTSFAVLVDITGVSEDDDYTLYRLRDRIKENHPYCCTEIVRVFNITHCC